MNSYRIGIDIGSTTVKLAALDERGGLIHHDYRRHQARTQETLRAMLDGARAALGEGRLAVSLTGSGAVALARALKLPFVQEVVAVASALAKRAPAADAAIELGGEDAKLLFLRPTLEARMNGVCAGGTGAFIDQMATLLHTDAAGLDRAARDCRQCYPIAARCGVFAKSDIQPLINEGAALADLAASVFRAVVSQTVSGLACGRPIRGRVVLLGGPLHFLPELRRAFIRELKLREDEVLVPEDAHLYAALGAALTGEGGEALTLDGLLARLDDGALSLPESPRLPPLFRSREEYEAFAARHRRAAVPRGELRTYRGDCFLGLDAGSTTSKLALIGSEGELLYAFYAPNRGRPIETALEALHELREQLPEGACLRRSCATGYGEKLLQAALSLDEGEVETVAHSRAAAFFEPELDCVLDIGGQDMKCIRLKNGAIDSILLNEACSSGCGSFLESFAASLGVAVEDFAEQALFAPTPVELGARCTVFMNSSVKQAQQEGASLADISAGLAVSIVKNALYKVIKLSHPEQLGRRVVVQGGTFCNRAVLRAFEQLSGLELVCPDVAGMMGAFGAALLARERYRGQPSQMPPLEELLALRYETSSVRCGKCVNNCLLTVSSFPDGRRHVSGNRCERGLGGESKGNAARNLFAYKQERLFAYSPLPEEKAPRGTIGIPRALNLYENYPFWAVFFRELGFRVLLSPLSDRRLYELGMASIPSESACYPAKLAHGHVQWLVDQGVETIFHPCVFYERKESPMAQDHYNCPLVIGCPEGLHNSLEQLADGHVRYLRPFLSFGSREVLEKQLADFCLQTWGIARRDCRKALRLAWDEQLRAKADILARGEALLREMRACGGRGLVLAGRPYHLDPEINHAIPELVAACGLWVFSEDGLPRTEAAEPAVFGGDQWVYHSRLYSAARFVCSREELELVQLNSFGCGLDAVTKDRLRALLEEGGKLYTVLRIDEISNLGAARIRIRSLLAAMDQRKE